MRQVTLRSLVPVVMVILAHGLCAQGLCAQEAELRKEARELLDPYGWDRFPPLLVRALDTWLEAEDFYWKGDYASCKKRLDRLWVDHPPGTRAWGRSRSPVREVFLGRYVHLPTKNKWHQGTITRVEDENGKPVLRWRDDAGVSWKLYPELEKGILHTGRANPYYKKNPTRGRTLPCHLEA